MPNHFSWRPIDSISGVDASIPVVSLRDGRDVERAHFVLFSDADRRGLVWLIDNAEVRRSMLVVHEKRIAWYDRFWGRMAIAVGALAATADFILAIKAAFGR